MKKNKAMRLASVLLILTLLTTSVISGTFAKYVTEETATSTARVAKWGVAVTASGSLFDVNYFDNETNTTSKNEPTSGTSNISVKSSDTSKLVAPGTTSGANGLEFTVTGTPEVKTKISVTTGENNISVFLNAGTWMVLEKVELTTNDSTKGYYKETEASEGTKTYTLEASDEKYVSGNYYKVVGDKLTVSSKYEPVVWKIDGSDVTATGKVAGSLDALKSCLESKSTTKDANTSTATSFKVTFEWPYEKGNDAAIKGNDKLDTFLGNIQTLSSSSVIVTAAESTATTFAAAKSGTDYSTTISLDVTVTATQVD